MKHLKVSFGNTFSTYSSNFHYVFLLVFVFFLYFCFQILIIMALTHDKDLKRFYSIKEVAAQFDVNESTLRYWEKIFPTVHPKTTPAGVRQYTKDDIDAIRLIHNLVKVRGYKLAAAKKMLHANREGVDKSTQVLETLIAARDQLRDLKKQLDTIV